MLYITSPWQSHKIAITEMTETQVRWVRLVLGFGFFALGWLKIYNYHLTAGVADNYPSVMDDPMIGFFAMGTNPVFRRENWIIAFALAEVLSGFMMMMGIFTRVWGSLMLWVFTKLMLVNFGWEEIPHIYPIAATLAMVFSNKARSEFSFVEQIQRKAGREGRTVFRLASVLVASLAISVVAVYTLALRVYFHQSNESVSQESVMNYASAKQIVIMVILIVAFCYAFDYYKNPQLWHQSATSENAPRKERV